MAIDPMLIMAYREEDRGYSGRLKSCRQLYGIYEDEDGSPDCSIGQATTLNGRRMANGDSYPPI